MICPLCTFSESQDFGRDKFRTYHRCLSCSLIFVPRESLLSYDQEAHRYHAHQNLPDDPHYRDYLTQIANGMAPYLKENDFGLDFGCGKTTVLADILISYARNCDSYDPLYHPDETYLQKKYDFIVLSEVIEHLSDPREVMLRLKNLLKEEGRVFVKTKLAPDKEEDFASWFYKRDLTHVQFFNDDSFKALTHLLRMHGPKKTENQDLYYFWS